MFLVLPGHYIYIKNDFLLSLKNVERPETTYNGQGMTWEDLKRPKTAYNEQGTTGNNLKRSKTTYNEQETT